MRIVADAAIWRVEETFSRFGSVRAVAGRAIDASAVRDADVLLVRSVTPVGADLLRGSHVRFVGTATAGVDHLDTAWLEDHEIRWASAPGCNANAVVEYVLAAMLAAIAKPLASWGPVAVVGFGAIGKRLTARLRGLGVRVRVCDPPVCEARRDRSHRSCATTPEPEHFHSLEDALNQAAIVSVHVPLVDNGQHPTRHLLHAENLATLADDALVINTSRGGVVDETALVRWCASKRGRAVLDVWEGEPELAWDLLCPGSGVAIATPHVAGYSVQGKQRASSAVEQALAAYLGAPTRPASPSAHARHSLPLGSLLAAAAGPTDAARRVLEHACPVREDDLALRGLLRLPKRARSAAFERLRRDYDLRCELHGQHVQADELAAQPPALGRLLGVLGLGD